MLKENLRFDDVSEDTGGLDFKVTAEYEFLNSTNQIVTIPMAFPLPDDLCGAANSPYMNFAEGSFFHVWVEGRETKYATETRAFRSQEYIPTSTKDLGKDYTGLLREFGIVPESCKTNESVSQARRTKLLTLGLLDRDTNLARWTVRRKYYWTQTFGAGKTHIRIEYAAQAGYSDVYLGKGWDEGVVQATEGFWRSELSNTCGGADLEKKVVSEMSQPEGFVKVYWIDFVLVTANYWNGPIKDFVLTVNTSNAHASFCWEGPVKRVDTTQIVATAHDLSPKRDLHIGFFEAF